MTVAEQNKQKQILKGLVALGASGTLIVFEGTKFWVTDTTKAIPAFATITLLDEGLASQRVSLRLPEVPGLPKSPNYGNLYKDVQSLDAIGEVVNIKLYMRTLNPELKLEDIERTANSLKAVAERNKEKFVDSFDMVRQAVTKRDLAIANGLPAPALQSIVLAEIEE